MFLSLFCEAKNGSLLYLILYVTIFGRKSVRIVGLIPRATRVCGSSKTDISMYEIYKKKEDLFRIPCYDLGVETNQNGRRNKSVFYTVFI